MVVGCTAAVTGILAGTERSYLLMGGTATLPSPRGGFLSPDVPPLHGDTGLNRPRSQPTLTSFKV